MRRLMQIQGTQRQRKRGGRPAGEREKAEGSTGEDEAKQAGQQRMGEGEMIYFRDSDRVASGLRFTKKRKHNKKTPC